MREQAGVSQTKESPATNKKRHFEYNLNMTVGLYLTQNPTQVCKALTAVYLLKVENNLRMADK